MANPEHVAILKQGVEAWNTWREANPDVKPDLIEANLTGAILYKADLSRAILLWANLTETNLTRANLTKADLAGAILYKADLSRVILYNAALATANLTEANLTEANLSKANLTRAILLRADLTQANLTGANFTEANLTRAILLWANLTQANLSWANLSGASLTEANLERATLVETNFESSDLSDCRIYGISAWNVNLKDTKQSNLVITREDEPEITVDNLQVAQFIYLLLNNSEIRHVIDTITSKAVLILGRFTEERKAVLDAIRDELRKRDYLPIVFDFDKPANRDLTETIITLAGMSRFVIADLSDPHSIPHELMAFAEKLPNVPVKPIFCPVDAHPNPYPMLEHFKHYHWVLPIYPYEDSAQLLASLTENVIEPAEAKVKELRSGK